MGKNHERNLLPLFLAKTKFPEVTGIVTAILPRSVKGKDKHVGTDFYSGPEGARVKVSPMFFVIIIIIICVFCAPNFLCGYKAQTRIEPG